MRLAGGRPHLSGCSTHTRSLHKAAFTPLHHSKDTNNKPTQDRPCSPTSTWSVQARSLLRAILREGSYLPDPQAGEYVAKHAVARFRTYSSKVWEQRKDPTLEARLKDRHDEARKALKSLQRANRGERQSLLRILLLAYGRAGKRRNELLEPWIRDLDTTSQDVSPNLHALLTSQSRVSPPKLTRPNPRLLKPEIPALNTWMRPMPQSRVKNMTKKWWEDTLNRLLPPLPAREWYRLQRLASGREELELPKRRTAIAAATPPPSALEMVLTRGKGIVHRSVFEEKRSREVTPRLMQRLWAQVFAQCPLAEWDATKERWELTWGQHAMHIRKQPSEDRSDRPTTISALDTTPSDAEKATTVQPES